MGSALLDTAFDPGTLGTRASPDALKLLVAERLAAHRSRRGRAQTVPLEAARSEGTLDERAARIAAVVAERYARSQSYRAYLAAEAERAVQQAQAEAEVAALKAQAMLAAQQTLLETLSRDGFDAEVANAEREVAELQATLATRAAANRDAAEDRRPGRPGAEIQEGPPWEMSLWPELELGTDATPRPRSKPGTASAAARNPAHAKARHNETATANADGTASEEAHFGASGHAAHGGLRVRLFDQAVAARLLRSGHGSAAGQPAEDTMRSREPREDYCDAEALALDEEIAFRQSPVFEERPGPPMPLPANLIEFPRQLVASRKARPRLAEGPLRDDAEVVPGGSQLRIFEVDPAQISTTPAAVTATTPQWTSIWLDARGQAFAQPDAPGVHASTEPAPGVPAMFGAHASTLPQVASIGRRVAAAMIDGGVILAGFLAAAAMFVWTSSRSLPPQPDGPFRAAMGHALRTTMEQAGSHGGTFLAAGALSFAFLYLLYQALFFSLSEATPGMRCVRIALCTFDDENPTRPAMLRRALAVLLSACPLGLGFLWAALDEERLTWHDRVSQMYQRCY
jgi:uncharacterized RDD family membrane protein YckC